MAVSLKWVGGDLGSGVPRLFLDCVLCLSHTETDQGTGTDSSASPF